MEKSKEIFIYIHVMMSLSSCLQLRIVMSHLFLYSTDGVHLHTITAPDEETLERIKEALDEKHILFKIIGF